MDQTVLGLLSEDIRGEDSLDRSLPSGQGTPFHLPWFGFSRVVPSSNLARRLGKFLIGACLLLGLSGSSWAFPFINKDGQRVEIADHLPEEQATVVFFHAPWSKTSGRYQTELAAWEKKQSKVAILGVQVKSLNSAVAKQYSIKEVPSFYIYNEKGELTHQGQPALNEVLKMMKESTKP